MKIDPTDKLQAAIKPASVNQNEKTSHGNFASVFEQKVTRPEGPLQGPMPPVSLSMPPSLQTMTGPINHEMKVNGLLDSLERYRQLLTDGTATLRDLAPTVEKMKVQSDEAREVLKSIADDDPLEAVLHETILVITQEVERFNLGVYAED